MQNIPNIWMLQSHPSALGPRTRWWVLVHFSEAFQWSLCRHGDQALFRREWTECLDSDVKFPAATAHAEQDRNNNMSMKYSKQMRQAAIATMYTQPNATHLLCQIKTGCSSGDHAKSKALHWLSTTLVIVTNNATHSSAEQKITGVVLLCNAPRLCQKQYEPCSSAG